MPKVDDARYRKCEERIRAALVELLSTRSLTDIGVSELAREAGVSRATFYAHYDNVADVYDQLVQEVVADVQTFEERFACRGALCGEGNRPTYCEQIRSKGEWSGVTRDPRFFTSMMALGDSGEPLIYDGEYLGINKEEVEALRLFQMSGCHAVATSRFAEEADWLSTRDLIDTFIEGGLDAVRRRKKNRN